MKKLSLYALLFCFCISISVETNSEETIKRYGIEKGVVEYKYTGAEEGTEIVYFDRCGMREARYKKTKLTLAGMTQKSNTLTLLDSKWTYNIDLDKRTGTKIETTLLKEIVDKSGSKDLGKVGENMMKSMGGEKIGSEEIAGKMCDVWEIKSLNSRSWVWNYITLQTEVKMMGMEVTTTATRIEEGAEIPEEKFAIPSDVQITERQDIKKILEGMKKGMKKNK